MTRKHINNTITDTFSIGLINISLSYPAHEKIIIDRAMRNFSASHHSEPDISFTLNCAPPTIPDGVRELFTTAPTGLWRIFDYPAAGEYIIALQNMERDHHPYKVVHADREFKKFNIFSEPIRDGAYVPLEYPLDELAISGYLNLNQVGIILHAACVSINGVGVLFSGTSGSGKSTISELFMKENTAEVLTDERVIIRKHEGKLWAFGTPWHGTAEVHKNAGAVIEKIFFIKHGRRNHARTIPVLDAANRLMVRCFPTFWNREGMEFAVSFCSTVAEKTACYDLEFLPDMSVVEYIKGVSPLDYEKV
ncbi:MAG: hypothetical protein D6726_10650 [Nitrospirae bacterium]|nr:MAG: hypothetical protein D6726_10650 [Nitrospirota bacterium]